MPTPTNYDEWAAQERATGGWFAQLGANVGNFARGAQGGRLDEGAVDTEAISKDVFQNYISKGLEAPSQSDILQQYIRPWIDQNAGTLGASPFSKSGFASSVGMIAGSGYTPYGGGAQAPAASAPAAPLAAKVPQSMTLVDIYNQRSDLQRVFPGGTDQANPNNRLLNDWWNQYGVNEYPGVTLSQPAKSMGTPSSGGSTSGSGGGTSGTQQGGAAGYNADQQQAARDAANAQLNAVMSTEASTLSKAGVGYDDDIKKLTASMIKTIEAGQTNKPKSQLATLNEQRAQLGVGGLETELAGVDAEIAQLEADYTGGTEGNEQRLVSMTEINRNQSQRDLVFNRAKRDLQVQRNSVANSLDMKYGVLNAIMSATGQDAANARQDYQTQLSSISTLTQLLTGISDREKSQQERLQDNARANVQIMANLLTTGALSFGSLSATQKLSIKNMELLAGLPSGFTAFVSKTIKDPIKTFTEMTNAAGQKIVSLVTQGADGQLHTTSVNLGAVKNTSKDTPDSGQVLQGTLQAVVKGLEATKGTDGMYDPDKYAAARAAILKEYKDFDIKKLDDAVAKQFGADAIRLLREKYGISITSSKPEYVAP